MTNPPSKKANISPKKPSSNSRKKPPNSPLLQLQTLLHSPLLITTQPLLRYLLGFTGTFGNLVLTRHNSWFFTDPRYTTVAQTQIPSPTQIITLSRTNPHAFRNFLTSQHLRSLSVLPDQTTLLELKNLQKNLSPLSVKPLTKNPLTLLRSQKNPTEIRSLRHAGKLTSSCFKLLRQRLRLGMSELDLAWEIQLLSRSLGSDGLAFDPIVAFGANTATPHHQTGPTTLTRGDHIQLDFGLKSNGYLSDLSRIIFTTPPPPRLKSLYQKVLQTQSQALASLKPNLSVSTLASRFPSYTYPTPDSKPLISHGLGHGVGLEIHEHPSLKTKSKDHLLPHQVLTIEPGLYHTSYAGIRLEDTVLLTPTSYTILTPAPKSIRANTVLL